MKINLLSVTALNKHGNSQQVQIFRKLLTNNISTYEDIYNRLNKASQVFRGLSRLIINKVKNKNKKLHSSFYLFFSAAVKHGALQFSITASPGICNKVS